MKIVKAIIAIVLVAAVGAGAFIFLTSPEQKIKGGWESDYVSFEFDKDGNVEITYLDATKFGIDVPIKGTHKGTYTIEKEDGKTYLEIETKFTVVVEVSYDFRFELEFEDGNMILTPIYGGEKGEEIEFTKAE